MARGSQPAQAATTQATNNSNAFFGNANQLYNTVVPQLTAEAANPTGYSPADEAMMETQAEQGAGGSNAGAAGQGALLAARTRNKGAPAAAIADSTRGSGEQLSKDFLDIATGNARLKQQQRQNALSGLTGLTGTETGATNTALGEVAPLVNANTSAINASYDPFTDVVNPLLGDLSRYKGYGG